MSPHHTPRPLSLDRHSDDDLELNLPANTSSANAVPSLCGIPLKYLSLLTLAVQNSALTIIMHYSRVSTPASQAYSAATAVLMTELLKGTISLIIAFSRIDSTPAGYEPLTPHLASQRPLSRLNTRLRKLGSEVFSPDCWKLSIPAILYVIQNNLQYMAASNLDAATFQVTYQMKILTTAAFSVILLRKKLSPSQWLSLLLLALGVGIVQLQAVSNKITPGSSVLVGAHDMNPMKGFLAVTAACFTSGLAGVYFEMVLKNTPSDLWIRNVQLSLFSLLPALAPIIYEYHNNIDQTGKGVFEGLFMNFGVLAWATVLVQVLGGLITAVVIKYSDNILKGFATSLSIVFSFLASVALFSFHMSITFVLGSAVVLIATWLYNQHPARVTESFTWLKSSNSTSEKPGRDSTRGDEEFYPLSMIPSTSSGSSSSSSSSSSAGPSHSNLAESEARPFIR
ncbi:nucleotide-sugar transporter [Agrocybe pediades]|nr:nucleotide-sugar transporter [Agrocybe pediades]